MTNEELNRFIHETVLGKCWHTVAKSEEFAKLRELPFPVYMVCDQCGDKVFNYHKRINPDYCNDLNAVREAEIKTVERFGYEYCQAVEVVIQSDNRGLVEVDSLLLADALTRARAVYEVWNDQ